MDEKPTTKSRLPALWVYIIWYPSIVILTPFFIYYIWGIEKVIPELYLNMDLLDAAIRLSSLATLPLILNIFAMMMIRFLGSAFDPIRGSESEFLQVNKNVLRNTLEQTFLFVFNLLAAAHWKQLSVEKLALVTLVFLGSRILFWISYTLGTKMRFPPLRGPFFAITLLNTLALLGYNIFMMLKAIKLIS